MKGFSQLKRISLTLISLLGSYLFFFFSASLIAQRAMYVHLNGSTVRLEITLQKENKERKKLYCFRSFGRRFLEFLTSFGCFQSNDKTQVVMQTHFWHQEHLHCLSHCHPHH